MLPLKVELRQGKYEKFHDIATLAITEVIDLEFDEEMLRTPAGS